jgi:hypothetical protein
MTCYLQLSAMIARQIGADELALGAELPRSVEFDLVNPRDPGQQGEAKQPRRRWHRP